MWRSSGARFDEARERFKSRTFEKHCRGQLVVELIFDQRGKFGCGKRIQAHGCERHGRVDIAHGDAQHIGRKLRQSRPQRVARREMEGSSYLAPQQRSCRIRWSRIGLDPPHNLGQLPAG